MAEFQNNYQHPRTNNGPYIVIIVLLVIIAVLAFFLWRGWFWESPANNSWTGLVDPSDITVTIISDVRCATCDPAQFSSSLEALPALAGATFEQFDFSESAAQDIMQANGVSLLPAILFSSNGIADPNLVSYLKPTSGGKFSLDIGATFNPYAKRSERGFLLLEDGLLDDIKANSHVYGNPDAPLAWVEYSDVQCTYCKKLHNEGTHDALFETFWDELSQYYQYYAIFNREIPEVLECMIEQKGPEIQFNTLKEIFKNEISTKQWVIDLVDGIDTDTLNACIRDGKYKTRIDHHMDVWSKKFGVTGTPWNVLINTETGEYEVLPGAYPVADFERVLNSLRS